ncbi:FemAB family protein [Paramagnetospirillum magnetotacticum MS-1]|uniref:FemAB family protein n=1 Tax=Paramagnetospirillum magnetotacticum MS-1 TaxID=272627 RepID=A0A0C2YDD1_PARME|nr:GNAT family N-acetyltransferase [Paramagnetospirillum magnetotacticum]KIL97709.1 FemAB family protein [Paramagnetospirillum magnetotacticum MS-1]
MSPVVTWDGMTREEWETAFASAGRSTLVQSWAYGEAKRAEGGWVPRRAVISQEGKLVALAQVLEKRIGGLVRVGRLNRGPVWLAELSLDQKLAVIAALRSPWRVWRLGALSLAPELSEGSAVPGFFARKADHWCSAWVDLSFGAEVLRKRLDGKWRNMLNASERAGLTIEASPDLLPWMLDRYRSLLAERGFGATPPELVQALADQAFRPDDLLVLRAVAESGEAVAGILTARHGDAATYLIGWNGDEGRKRKANNALLWAAMVELPRRGVRFLDLGGIDDRLTPGIAAFKRGINGEEYRLAGEFLSA